MGTERRVGVGEGLEGEAWPAHDDPTRRRRGDVELRERTTEGEVDSDRGERVARGLRRERGRTGRAGNHRERMDRAIGPAHRELARGDARAQTGAEDRGARGVVHLGGQ